MNGNQIGTVAFALCGMDAAVTYVPLDEPQSPQWRVTARRSDGAVAEAMNEVIVNDVYYLGVYNFAI